jgi:tellurite resistance protein
LYGEARQLHQNGEWQAVVDIFARIYLEDANYPDPEGLLASAHEALETARKEEELLRQYREVVEAAWADGELDSHEVERLRDLADELDLSPNHTSEIERTVTGDSKEAILESQERAAEERYRNVVEEAWADNHVSDADSEQLGALARELDLSMDTVVAIEREVMGETKEAILDRQEQASAEHYRTAVEEASTTDNELSNAEAKWLSNLASELGLSTDTAADIEREVIDDTIPAILQRQRRLDELYVRARQLHQGQEWQSVVDVFEQIHLEAPAYPDPEGLLEAAHEAQERELKVGALYDRGQRYVKAEEWQQALECFEEVKRLESSYRDTEELLSRVRRELAPPSRAKVPDLSGQEVPQANSILTREGLNLGAQREAPSDTVSKGQIIGHSPEAGREVEIGSSVSVTISLGPSTVSVPDLVGKSRDKALDMLYAVGLRLGAVVKAPSNEVAEGKIVEQYPTVESKVERGTAVRVTVAQGPIEDLTEEKPSRQRSYPRPDSLPDEPELRRQVELFSHESKEPHSERGRKSGKPPDLPD